MSGDTDSFCLGQLVYSRAGRDRRRPFLVWRIEPDRIYLVDGKIRRTTKPKKKNPLHVQPVNRMATDIAARLMKGETVTDAEVRRAIELLTSGTNEG
ncbi:MAG: hypothetical protein PWP65_534 [Clostridia bacterium]|nr:hypothetical protein [Clostridia bacterium]